MNRSLSARMQYFSMTRATRWKYPGIARISRRVPVDETYVRPIQSEKSSAGVSSIPGVLN